MTARDIAHRYARKAHMCAYNKHSDKHQEHSEFCDALCADIEAFVRDEKLTFFRDEKALGAKA